MKLIPEETPTEQEVKLLKNLLIYTTITIIYSLIATVAARIHEYSVNFDYDLSHLIASLFVSVIGHASFLFRIMSFSDTFKILPFSFLLPPPITATITAAAV